jgi:hypothetical protein
MVTCDAESRKKGKKTKKTREGLHKCSASHRIKIIRIRFSWIIVRSSDTKHVDYFFIPSADDQLSTDIYPRVHRSVVTHLILESTCIVRILLAGSYTRLTSLTLFNIGHHISLHYFTNEHSVYSYLEQLRYGKIEIKLEASSDYFCLDESSFQHVFQRRITELILENNDNRSSEMSLREYTANAYASILFSFENLKHSSIVGSFMSKDPSLLICDLPSPTFSSSILTKLCTNVNSKHTCFYLLDGRFK